MRERKTKRRPKKRTNNKPNWEKDKQEMHLFQVKTQIKRDRSRHMQIKTNTEAITIAITQLKPQPHFLHQEFQVPTRVKKRKRKMQNLRKSKRKDRTIYKCLKNLVEDLLEMQAKIN